MSSLADLSLGALLSSILSLSFPVFAQEPDASEHQVKAAFLISFTGFIEWDHAPKNANPVVCSLGVSEVGRALQALVRDPAVGHVVVRSGVDATQLEGCGLLFIPPSDEARLPSLQLAAERAGTITVSDIADFVERGGHIGFLFNDGRIRFEIDRARAERVGATISSRLLSLASRTEF